MITAIDTNILLDILLPNEKSYEAWIAPCKVRRQRVRSWFATWCTPHAPLTRTPPL